MVKRDIENRNINYTMRMARESATTVSPSTSTGTLPLGLSFINSRIDRYVKNKETYIHEIIIISTKKGNLLLRKAEQLEIAKSS